MSDGRTIYLIVHDLTGSRFAFFEPDIAAVAKHVDEIMRDHGGSVMVTELGADVAADKMFPREGAE